MPIEIKELNIKINVDEKTQTTGSASPAEGEKETIISACVEQVMDILSKIQER